MAKFKDTPKWKKKPDAKRGAKYVNALAPKRPVCGAAPKLACKDADGHVRRAHRERREKANRATHSRRRLQQLQQKRWATVTIRYVCPDCGGDHPRAACLTDAA